MSLYQTFLVKPFFLLLKLAFALLLLIILIVSSFVGINLYMIGSNTLNVQELDGNIPHRPAALVLGASVKENGTPSPVLAERLDVAITLFKEGKIDKIVLSGDGQEQYYNEVTAMASYCESKGVPESALFLDPLGTSTSQSISRLQEIAPDIPFYIITQRYHIYRSLFLAKHFHIDAQGIPCDQYRWGNGDHHIQREFFARIKDFIYYQFPNLPTPVVNCLNKIVFSMKTFMF